MKKIFLSRWGVTFFTLTIALVGLINLAFSGASFAQPTTAMPATPEKTIEKAEKPKITRVTGEVSSVDAKAGMLTVKAKDKAVYITAESKVAKGAVEKVKVGDWVNVSYTDKNGKMIASSIVGCKPKEPAKKEEKKAESRPGRPPCPDNP